jgi:hypothetical protein
MQSISNGLTSVDGIGYCIRELGRRGLMYPHPWQSNRTIKESGKDSMEERDEDSSECEVK